MENSIKSNPDYYNKQENIPAWEKMIKIWGKEAFITHCEMTAYKYMQRLGYKLGSDINDDLDKALWYLNKRKEIKDEIKQSKSKSKDPYRYA